MDVLMGWCHVGHMHPASNLTELQNRMLAGHRPAHFPYDTQKMNSLNRKRKIKENK